MRFNKPLTYILDSQPKIICLRLLCNYPTEINGRQLSKIVKLSPTTVHKAMKELANEQIVVLKNYGNSHVYELNKTNRIVSEILKPMFNNEKILLDKFIKNVVKGIKKSELKDTIFSIVLFGSVQDGSEKPQSDIDLCVVVKESKDKKRVENLMFNINFSLKGSIGMSIAPYVKTVGEFKKDKELSVIRAILKSHRVIWGEPMESML